MACQVVPRAGPVVAGERGKQGVGLVFEQGQLDARVGAAEGAEQAGEAPVGQGVDQADGEAASEQAAERGHRLTPAVGRLQRGPRVRQQGLAGRGQLDPAPAAEEQVLAELGFEPADLLADGWLRDRDPLGRAGEVALLGDGYEVGKLPQFHKQSL